MDTPPDPVSAQPIATEDKTTAILSYLTFVGFIVAVIMHGSKKTRLGAFHLRQSLGLMLCAIVLGFGQLLFFFIPLVGWFVCVAAWLCLLVFWVMGLIAAADGEQKPVPMLGDHFQKWFGTAFD